MSRSTNRSIVSGLTAITAATAILGSGGSAFGLVINPTFTANFTTNFGANAVAAQNAWIAAATVFTANYTDPVTININVDAVAGTGVLGQSNTFILHPTYANLRTSFVADAASADDNTAVGAGGSITAADPTTGAGNWWVSRAQAKALGMIATDGVTDGTTTFGAGQPFTFAGSIAGGTFDFQGVAAHEISEVLGRIGIAGITIGSFTNSYSAVDLFSYSGPGTRMLLAGANSNFSINNGTTLLKLYNNAALNGGDTRDWASGANDAFNAFGSFGVTSPVSAVDLRTMDVIGYDPVVVPEPTMFGLLASGAGIICMRRRQEERKQVAGRSVRRRRPLRIAP